LQQGVALASESASFVAGMAQHDPAESAQPTCNQPATLLNSNEAMQRQAVEWRKAYKKRLEKKPGRRESAKTQMWFEQGTPLR